MVLSLALALTLGAPGLKDPPAKPDLLVGVWTLETIAFGGQVRPDPDGLRWEFAADGKYYRHRGDKRYEFRYELGPKDEPRALDLKMIPDKPDTGVIFGICKVDGDTLIIALPQNKRTVRPTDFETPKDTQVAVYVFKRVKPKN